jgi:alpha-beta hydrolase superfamily lysophospholipase
MLARRIGSTEITARSYAGLYHEILNEPERDQVLDDVCGWLAARVAARVHYDPSENRQPLK